MSSMAEATVMMMTAAFWEMRAAKFPRDRKAVVLTAKNAISTSVARGITKLIARMMILLGVNAGARSVSFEITVIAQCPLLSQADGSRRARFRRSEPKKAVRLR